MENYTIFDFEKNTFSELQAAVCSIFIKQERNSCKQSVREALKEHCSFLLMSIEFRFVFWLLWIAEKNCRCFSFSILFRKCFRFQSSIYFKWHFFQLICWMFTSELWSEWNVLHEALVSISGWLWFVCHFWIETQKMHSGSQTETVGLKFALNKDALHVSNQNNRRIVQYMKLISKRMTSFLMFIRLPFS